MWHNDEEDCVVLQITSLRYVYGLVLHQQVDQSINVVKTFVDALKSGYNRPLPPNHWVIMSYQAACW